MGDQLGRGRWRLEHLEHRIERGIVRRAIGRECLGQVVLRAAQLDIRPEQRPECAVPAFVRQVYAAGADRANIAYASVELHVRVHRRNDRLLDTDYELANEGLGSLGRRTPCHCTASRGRFAPHRAR